MEEKRKNKNNLSSINDGLLIAAATMAIYALAYSYESGFLSYYGVPSSLISIDATAMVSSVAFGLMYIIPFLIIISIGNDFSIEKTNTIKLVGTILIYFGIFFALYGFGKSGDIILF